MYIIKIKLILVSVFLVTMSGCATDYESVLKETIDNINRGVKSITKGTKVANSQKSDSTTVSKAKKDVSNQRKNIKDDLGLQPFDYYYIQYVKKKGIKNLTQQEILYSLKLNDFQPPVYGGKLIEIEEMSAMKFRKLLQDQQAKIAIMMKDKKYDKEMQRYIDSATAYRTGHFDFDNNNFTLYRGASLGNFSNSRKFLPKKSFLSSAGYGTKMMEKNTQGLEYKVGETSILLAIEHQSFSPLLRKKLASKYADEILELSEKEMFKDFKIKYRFILDKKINFIEVDDNFRNSYVSLKAKLNKITVFYKGNKVIVFNEKEVKNIPNIANKVFFNRMGTDDPDGDILGTSVPTLLFKNSFPGVWSNLKKEAGVNLKKLKPKEFCKTLKARSITEEEIRQLYVLGVFDAESKFLKRQCNSFPFYQNGKNQYFSLKSLSTVNNVTDACNPICVKNK